MWQAARRTALRWIVSGFALAIAAAISAPALVAGLSPMWRPRPRRWVSIGPVSRFEVGKVAQVVIGRADEALDPAPGESVYVWRAEEKKIVIFSRACTDLGCAVNHDPGSGFFYCPCHGGIFNQAGQVVAGPPEKPLYRYAIEIVDGEVKVDLGSVPIVA